MDFLHSPLFISPHEDDLAFSLGCAFIDGFFNAGVIITVFSISNNTIDNRDKNIHNVSKTRKQENEDFFSNCSGSYNLIYLDRLDAPLRLGIKDNQVFNRLSSDINEKEKQYIYFSLKPLAKKSGILFAPLGLGFHVDHILLNEVACNLSIENKLPAAFYEDLPYASRLEPRDIEQIVKKIQYKIKQPLKQVDIKSFCDPYLKCRKISLYKSQINQSLINEIISYGKLLGSDTIVERIWCNPEALKKLKLHSFYREYKKYKVLQ